MSDEFNEIRNERIAFGKAIPDSQNLSNFNAYAFDEDEDVPTEPTSTSSRRQFANNAIVEDAEDINVPKKRILDRESEVGFYIYGLFVHLIIAFVVPIQKIGKNVVSNQRRCF